MYFVEDGAWGWGATIVRAKVAQALLVGIAVAKGQEVGELVEIPRVAGVGSLV